MFPKSLFGSLFLISLSLSSCEFHCSVGESKKEEKEKQYKPVEKEGALLYNGIRTVTRGVQINKAYLVTNDEEAARIEEDNFIDVKRGVGMIVHIKEGWKPVDEKVRLGATVQAVADNGTVILEEADLFKKYDVTGVSIADSKLLDLSFYLTKWTATRPVSIKVTFKIWDKQSDAFIEGDYTVHTK